MPIYDFKCNSCEDIFTVTCRIAEKDNQSCPKCSSNSYEHHHTTGLAIGDSVRLGVKKTDNGFKEVLSKIASNNYKSNLADKLSRK